MASPIQIVLNPENYEDVREKGGFGSRTDFFADQDIAFRQHKAQLINQLQAIAQTLNGQPSGEIGYAKVILRRAAWAKSHRPITKLFTRERAPVIGGGALGVMIVEMTPSAALSIARDIRDKAEEHTIKRDGKDNPSVYKSEAGAIQAIQLYDAADKRDFSLEEAVAWLSSEATGGSYQIELFELPPSRQHLDALSAPMRQLFSSFIDGLKEMGSGLTANAVRLNRHLQPLLAVRLATSALPPVIKLVPVQDQSRSREIAPLDVDASHHQKLLAFLDKHPLVRRIDLPGKLVRSSGAPLKRIRPQSYDIPLKNSQRSYPKMGVIDGGITPLLSDWVIYGTDFLAEEHANLHHGSFIAGLAAFGAHINGAEICSETDYCELADLNIFPDTAPGIFAQYFSDLSQFLDEVENAISEARNRYGVRIFNFSLNIQRPVNLEKYSVYAERLDQIADAHDVLIFISAGNAHREEWHAQPERTLAALANARNDDIQMPAESVRNIAVAALNPSGLSNVIASAPARYSRRGPGMRTGVKPDLAQIGGSGTPDGALGTGLYSLTPDGGILDGCGTSYATPLLAKTAAVLDHAIEGDVSRETLTALLIHNAQLPAPLQGKNFLPVARHLVGFGMPPSANDILETDDHSITLVFATRIRPKQQMSFKFSWPACLITPEGKCRGRAKLTLVSSPPIDSRFGAELMRINLECALQQEEVNREGKSSWKGKLDPIYLPNAGSSSHYEAELIDHGLKWSPVKMFEKTMPLGIGSSSNWRLSVNYLERALEKVPEEGIPFTVILTIEDPDKAAPVFNDMKQTLQSLGVQISDIRTAARITSRV